MITIRGKKRTVKEVVFKLFSLTYRIIIKQVSYFTSLIKLYFIKIIKNSILTNRKHSKLGPIKLYAPNYRTFYRSKNAHKKEPMTHSWIESMKEGETFWDIGANIGVFSLLAAKRGCNVVAFEPLYSNYYVLCKNIEINPDLQKHIAVLPIALAENDKVDTLYIPVSESGYSGVSFGNPINPKGKHLDFNTKMTILGLTGDSLSRLLPENLSYPDYIKIDVDGLEHEILEGIQSIIKNNKLKALLVEIDHEWSDKKNRIENILKTNGFENFPGDCEATVLGKKNPVSFNYIFRRQKEWKI